LIPGFAIRLISAPAGVLTKAAVFLVLADFALVSGNACAADRGAAVELVPGGRYHNPPAIARGREVAEVGS